MYFYQCIFIKNRISMCYIRTICYYTNSLLLYTAYNYVYFYPQATVTVLEIDISYLVSYQHVNYARTIDILIMSYRTHLLCHTGHVIYDMQYMHRVRVSVRPPDDC